MKLYGVPASRATRSIWAAEEVGVDYELVSTSFMEESKTPEYLAINPNGRVPALVDGDLVLFESMAINLYLAKTYGGKLYPSNPQDEARAIQWTIWGMTELEPHLIPMVLHKVFFPEDQRDPAIVAKAEVEVERPLAVLDAQVVPIVNTCSAATSRLQTSTLPVCCQAPLSRNTTSRSSRMQRVG